MSEGDRSPGWDKAAVNRIASSLYGNLQTMFDSHGWSTDGRVISQIASTKVVETYGSVDAFVKAHKGGLAQNYILNPMAAIDADPPQVIMTSYYGFDPENWPCLTFTDRGRIRTLLAETRPGFLAVIYGSISNKVPADMRGRVLGIYQLTHDTGETMEFLSPAGRQRKLKVQKEEKSWKYAFRALRAWRVAPDSAPLVSDFAPDAYSSARGTPIGRYGTWLFDDAKNILDLDLIPEPVFATDVAIESVLEKGRDALKPSRPGPVSQSSYMVREAEGPKYIYILELDGNADHFLGGGSLGRKIIKVGFSKSPATRCLAHNRVLPWGAFRWRVIRSTLAEGLPAFPSSRHAMAGEQEMVRLLTASGKPLGGEFFLANQEAIEAAWAAGKAKAGGFAQ